MSKKVLLLYSGGLDSTVLLYQLLKEGHDVYTLQIKYGQRHGVELAQAQKILADLKRLDKNYVYTIDWSPFRGAIQEGNHSAVHPNRNLMFLTIAGAWAVRNGFEAIYTGPNASDEADFPDCREAFYDHVQEAIKLSLNKEIPIYTPLLKLTKQQIYDKALELGVPLDKIWYCYKPQWNGAEWYPCGDCHACLLMRDLSKNVKTSVAVTQTV